MAEGGERWQFLARLTVDLKNTMSILETFKQNDFIAGFFLNRESFDEFRNALEKEERDRDTYQRAYQVVRGVAGVLSLSGYANGKALDHALLFAVSLAMMVVTDIVYRLLDQRRPRPRVMKRILECMNSVDSARQTPPGSPERVKLAKRLVICSKVTTVFARGSWDMGPINSILRNQVRKVGQAIEDLAYPALLGTDRELRSIKDTLGEITYLISINNWLDIVTVVPSHNRYDKVRTRKLSASLSASLSAFNFVFVAMAALPAFPLIAQAFKYMGL